MDLVLSKLSSAQIHQLSEIVGHVESEEIRRLALEKPAEITPTYKDILFLLRSRKVKRVDAQTRVERAWQGVWQRWLSRFDQAD